MNKIVPRKNLWQHTLAPVAGLMVMLLLLTACFGGGDEAAQEAVAPEGVTPQTGTLTCSPSCLNQGQCGTLADGRTVILTHSEQPTFHNHNAILENESAVNILNQQDLNYNNANGTPGTLTFFFVQLAAGGSTNWVAGSCLNLNQ